MTINRSSTDIIGVDESTLSHLDVKVNTFITQDAKWDTPHLDLALSNHPVVNILGISIPIHETEYFVGVRAAQVISLLKRLHGLLIGFNFRMSTTGNLVKYEK